MKRFAALFEALDRTTKTGEKVAALAAYFREAPEEDRVWTIALLSGRRPKRAVNATELRTWAAEVAGLPVWLAEECHPIVGDLAETISLVLPEPRHASDRTLDGWMRELLALTGRPAPVRRQAILDAWDRLTTAERFLFNKLITGGFRMGVSQGLMTRALAQATGVEEAVLAHRLMGDWKPATTSFESLTGAHDPEADASKPYPFALASPLEAEADSLGLPEDWFAEWKWDGIRGQVVNRAGAFALWSRGEELITDRFPDLAPLRDFLPLGLVIDAEVLAWTGSGPMPFAALQKRIGRLNVPKKILTEAPAHLLAYDLLEEAGEDLRPSPLSHRRARLEAILAALPAGLPISPSPLVTFDAWEALGEVRLTARERNAEGLMLKRRVSPYFVGRKRGDWWKWKLDPYTVDAVMLYAQQGAGRRATLFTDFTFAVRDGDDLVPFTKAYSGLTDAEFRQITDWVRRNTLERFGPVRRVPPQLVFELAFEGIQASLRHKSGIALRFPRMVRWRQDKPVAEIDTLDSLRELLAISETQSRG
ncbi:ATP-dependent DNA ligase [Cereibacter sphaeroides]|uniref:ATP-dependent DNA ligase n=1 Tax=Cereibacter sphaeroides TaxID=1063 RepID=UPI001F2E0357|nr:ATP-dependent DNA ligase [Cereibacter sphaeroides]MCE6961478.1 ATP-dependent DNA ligase [Cereibacter sphaeroides]MCE6967341.1 ATP-dependent DNA ligase [Cereibacter sphaeroides]MCE6971491.1 ATP-dependent DNA ligase [Cereibacter sphaeroides]